jgi:hypothetical protein
MDCIDSDNTCNLIKKAYPNAGDKQAVVQYANGNLPRPLFISKDDIVDITNNFKNMSGKLYFSDIYDNTNVKVPFNIVPSINDVSSSSYTLLSMDYNLLSNINNMNETIMQNLNLLTK